MRLSEFIEMCRNDDYFTKLTVSYDIENYLAEKTFRHPLKKSEKDEYISRKEIILTDLYEPPENVNGWYLKNAYSETSFVYYQRNLMCSINRQEDGSWIRSYGSVIPVGVCFGKEIAQTREEAVLGIREPGMWKKGVTEKKS